MKNNFPRIHSLSTIGIKQHFNADYLLHPNRTDFSGESGSGKSMVSDMIQLILIGSGDFSSSTDGNKPREIKGMLLPNKGKSAGRGYVFLNIEIKPNQFVVIGAYIESSSNHAELFIIQKGYDWELLTPMEVPLYNRHLIFEEKIFPINEIQDKLEKGVFKKFRRRQYHEILFNNEIISSDLSSKDTLKSYASILRSFSRGKGFNVDSKSLKNFLFGSDDQNVIKQNYENEVSTINNDFHEHKRYLAEIEVINKKQVLIQEVLGKHDAYSDMFEEYSQTKLNFWRNEEKIALGNKNKLDCNYFELLIQDYELKKRLKQLEDDDLNQLRALKKDKLNFAKSDDQKKERVQKEYLIGLSQKEIIERVRQWFNKNDNELANVSNWFDGEYLKNKTFNELNKFIGFLTKNNIVMDFEKSIWCLNWENAERLCKEESEKRQEEIENLEVQLKFSDVSDKESLSSWAFDNLEFPVKKVEESVLLYFQKFTKKKPLEVKKGTRYLPFPDELFQNLDVKDQDELGFWLNLEGVYEYVRLSQNDYLNFENPEIVRESFKKIKENLNEKLRNLKSKLEGDNNLKDHLFNNGNIKENLQLYNRKEEILNCEIDEVLVDISREKFDEYVSIYDNRKVNLKAFEKAELRLNEINAENQRIKNIDHQILEIEKSSFRIGAQVSFKMIDEKSNNLKLEISDLENVVRKCAADNKLDRDDSLAKLDVNFEEENMTNLLKMQINLGEVLINVKRKREWNAKIILDAEEAIKDVNAQYFNFFDEKIKRGSDKLFSNPDEGVHSLKDRVNNAKISFEANYSQAKNQTDNVIFGDTHDIGELAHYLLPTIFKTTKVNKALITENITGRLDKLTKDIQEIGSRKIEILKKIFNDVYKVYNEYLTKITLIDSDLKKRSITGGNRASLEQTKSIDYPTGWLTPFRKQLDNQVSSIGLFKELKEEVDINKMMIKAFRDSGGSHDAEPEDLINPKSYFDLEFDLKLDNGDSNSGSNGQTYTGNALLGLARLSLIENKKRKGIKIMPIDEAEGLGSNYDMLHQLAKDEGYQIISMGIETTGDIIEGEQFIYIMNENKISDYETYVPPLAILSGGNLVEDIADHIDSL